jgi:hypothetical protein
VAPQHKFFFVSRKRKGIKVSWKILRRTTLDRFEAHKDFLQLTYDALVALAQKGYATEGRGMLLIPEEDVLENLRRKPSKPGPFLLRGRLGYCSQSAMRAQGYGQREKSWTQTYDPQHEIVVTITMEQPQGVASYRLRIDVGVDEAVASCDFYTSLNDGQ